MSKFKTLILILVLGALVLVFWGSFSESRQINQVRKDIPDYFVLEEEVSLYAGEGRDDLRLLKNEALKTGIRYEIMKPKSEAVMEVVSKMAGEGWAAIGGSEQDDSKTILKVGRDKDMLFIIFESSGSTGQEKTMVTVLPVLHQ